MSPRRDNPGTVERSRVVLVGNSYLLLNLRNAINNQRRNSIQMTPTRTKLAKPKTAFTMVILAAFYILLTHICSDYSLLPSCQSRRSNVFSPCQEPPFAGRQKSEFLNTGCRHTTHIISTTFTINHLRNCHRNHVRFKPTMATSCNLLVPSVLVTSRNVHPAGITGAAAKGNHINIDLNKFEKIQPAPHHKKPPPQSILVRFPHLKRQNPSPRLDESDQRQRFERCWAVLHARIGELEAQIEGLQASTFAGNRYKYSSDDNKSLFSNSDDDGST